MITNTNAAIANKVPALDVARVRQDFPILSRQVHGKPLVYFDTAASAQRPLAVIEATDRFYRMHNANVHRGVHTLSQEATDEYEAGRQALVLTLAVSNLNRNRREGFSRRKLRWESESRGTRGGGC